VERYYYLAFEDAEEQFREHLQEDGSPAAWEEMAAEQKVFKPIDKGEEKVTKVAEILPTKTDLETRWPGVLTDYETYRQRYEEQETLVIPPGWKTFSNSGGRKWDEKSEHKLKRASKIKEQLYIGILCAVLLAGALFILLRTMSRTMKGDSEGYYPPGGPFIPFGDMRKIDARKWDTKGLAYLYYDEGEKEKKTKIDGMVYGQFKKEEGEPAQKLYDRILANFRGEVIELVSEENEEESSSGEDREQDQGVAKTDKPAHDSAE
jgi:hypothetical protein